jgi:hypothetical protein
VAASVLLLLTAWTNAVPVVAESLDRIPLLGSLVRVLSFASYRMEEQGVRASVDIAQIVGLDNQELQDTINAELLADGQALVEQYNRDVADLKARFGDQTTIHITVESYYEVKCADSEVFSLQVEFFWAAGGSNTYFKFYNVDQKTGELITLDALFVEGSDYLSTINDHIIAQMKAETREDGKSVYWVNDDDAANDRFVGIDASHNFFINDARQLVIAFDKYEVGPGFLGTPQYNIPTELIAGVLAEGAPIR